MKQKKKKTFIKYDDPGHGWLRVPLKLVQELAISVSPYSYQKGRYVYLEEDLDASTFVEKVGLDNINIKWSHTNSESKIRRFQSFSQNWKERVDNSVKTLIG